MFVNFVFLAHVIQNLQRPPKEYHSSIPLQRDNQQVPELWLLKRHHYLFINVQRIHKHPTKWERYKENEIEETGRTTPAESDFEKLSSFLFYLQVSLFHLCYLGIRSPISFFSFFFVCFSPFLFLLFSFLSKSKTSFLITGKLLVTEQSKLRVLALVFCLIG